MTAGEAPQTEYWVVDIDRRGIVLGSIKGSSPQLPHGFRAGYPRTDDLTGEVNYRGVSCKSEQHAMELAVTARLEDQRS